MLSLVNFFGMRHAARSVQRAAWERWRGKGMGAATLIYGLHATALHMDATAALQEGAVSGVNESIREATTGRDAAWGTTPEVGGAPLLAPLLTPLLVAPQKHCVQTDRKTGRQTDEQTICQMGLAVH